MRSQLLVAAFVSVTSGCTRARESAPVPPPVATGPLRWTGDEVAVEDATRQAREILVARLDVLGRGGPGPPGATVFDATRWTVRTALRGALADAGQVALDLTVQTFPPEHAERVPRVGELYLVFVGGDSFGAMQIRKLLPNTPENLRRVEQPTPAR